MKFAHTSAKLNQESDARTKNAKYESTAIGASEIHVPTTAHKPA